MMNQLLTRRSVTAKDLGEPGPSDEQLEQILAVASRVPDHKKLEPFRFTVFKNNAREHFGDVLAEAFLKANPALANSFEIKNKPGALEALVEYERKRFTRAPVVVAVISSLVDNPKAPYWEQKLTAGAVCMNMLNAISALGFDGQWLTEWYAYNDDINHALKIEHEERIAGFIYIGTRLCTPAERPRPDLSKIVEYWEN